MINTKKLFIGLIIFTLISVVILVLLIFNKKNSYDISNFNNISVNDVIDLFSKEETNILFIGSEKCKECKKIISLLNNVKKEKAITINYLDFYNIDFDDNNTDNLISKLDIMIEESITNDKEDVEKNTFGYFLKNGLVPMVIIIENGKQKGGFIGNYSKDELNGWFNYILK